VRRCGGAISQSYLNALEHGRDYRTAKPIEPFPNILRVLARVYDVEYEYFMQLAGYLEQHQDVAELEQEWPEGVAFLRRASKQLTPAMKRKMIRAMQQFLIEDEPDQPSSEDPGRRS